MSLVNLMIQLVSGVVGGTAARGAFRRGGLEILDSSMLGALGGVCCAQLLARSGLNGSVLDLASMAGQIGGGILGGGMLVLLSRTLPAIRRTDRARHRRLPP